MNAGRLDAGGGRPPRFRTIQVCPKDQPIGLCQAQHVAGSAIRASARWSGASGACIPRRTGGDNHANAAGRYFLALCEELNFTRAARRCGVSQPSLTTAISVPERELGGALFDRKPSIALTALGRVVRPYLDEIARNAEHAREVARTLTPRPVADRSARQTVDSSEHLAN